MAAADLPGYYFDKEKKRYFRTPSPHLAYMASDIRAPPPSLTDTSKEGSAIVPSYRVRHPLSPKSIFSLTAHVSRTFDASHYALSQLLVCNSTRRGSVDLNGSVTGPSMYFNTCRKITHLLLNQSGNVVYTSLRLLELPSGVMFLTSEIVFDRLENKLSLCSVGFEACRIDSFIGPAMGISAHGHSDILLHCERYYNTGCIYVQAKTYETGIKEDIDQSTMSSRCHAARCRVTELPSAGFTTEALASTPTLSESVIGAIAIGSSHKCDAIHILGLPNANDLVLLETRYMPRKSIVFSLAFHEDTPLLYAGTRSGTVTTWDLRSNVESTSMTIKTSSKSNPSVIQMHPLENHYLLANCLDSKLLLLDTRMNRQVLSYPAHINLYHPCRSTVDKSQSFVAAVGEDKAIRLWSIWQGKLLRTIPETEYTASDQGVVDEGLPAIAWTNSLGGPGGVPAMLIGTPGGYTPFTL